MDGMSPRLQRRVKSDFQAARSADEVERLVTDATDSERIQAAIVMWSRGDLSRLQDALALARVDWRDVLVRAGLADDDWSSRLDTELGSPTTS
jgi:hypothetical protein